MYCKQEVRVNQCIRLIYSLVCKAYLLFSVEGGPVPMADHHPTCSSSSANSDDNDDDDDDLTVDVTSIEDVTVAAEDEGEGEDAAAGKLCCVYCSAVS